MKHSPEMITALAGTMRSSVSRRRLLQAAGISSAAMAAAACGTGGDGGTASEGSAPEDVSDTEKVVNWSNWVEYLDIDEDTGAYPTLDRFQEESGISVTYTEDVNDNNEFYAKVRTQLEQGQDIDRDIVVLTDWMAGLWIQNGFAQKLDKAAIPNSANLIPRLQNVSFDKPRDYTLPWQGGFAGLGYNIAAYQDATGNSEMTSLDQLFDPALKGRITLLSEMRDTMGCIIAWQGNDPSNFTQEQFEQAIDALTQQVASGQIRQVTGNDYLAALESGDVIGVIGWSGDIFALGEDFAFALPESGGTLWTDNLIIPVGATHKKNAETLINYYYDPVNAAELALWVNYITPVVGAQEAAAEMDPELAEDQLIFPNADTLAKSKAFRSLTGQEEQRFASAWQNLLLGA